MLKKEKKIVYILLFPRFFVCIIIVTFVLKLKLAHKTRNMKKMLNKKNFLQQCLQYCIHVDFLRLSTNQHHNTHVFIL